MKRFYKKALCLLLAAVMCTGIFSGCEALDTTLPNEETKQIDENRKAQANPKKALEQIYVQVGKRVGLVEPTQEQLESVVGLNMEDVERAYVRYVETDFGADDVYIILPKEGTDEDGNTHRENVLAAIRERKDDRIKEFVNYDVYNSSAIAEDAVIFERGGYVVMLMLEDNNSARRIVERYIPEQLDFLS